MRKATTIMRQGGFFLAVLAGLFFSLAGWVVGLWVGAAILTIVFAIAWLIDLFPDRKVDASSPPTNAQPERSASPRVAYVSQPSSASPLGNAIAKWLGVAIVLLVAIAIAMAAFSQ